MLLTINLKIKKHGFQQSEKCGSIYYFQLLDFHWNNFAKVIIPQHVFTFPGVLLLGSCWWRGCRDAHRFTPELMKTTVLKQDLVARLALLFSSLTFLFLNVYRANLSLSLRASQTGIVLSSLGRATDTKTTTKTETVKRFVGQELFSFFSVCLAERGWLLTGARDMPSVQRNRERERGCGRASNTFPTLCEQTRCFLLAEFVRAAWSEAKTWTDSFPSAWSEQCKKQTYPRPRHRSAWI